MEVKKSQDLRCRQVSEWSYNLMREGKGEKCLLDVPMQMLGGWVVGCTNLESETSSGLKIEMRESLESGRCVTSQNWIKPTRN